MAHNHITLLAKNHKEWIRLVCSFGEVSYAEDIVQETYIKIISTDAIHKAIINGNINKAFMYVVLRNNVIDYQRSKGKIHKVELHDRLADDPDEVEKHLALDIVDENIKNEINSWHWYDRDMFLHYMTSGKSQREIASGSKISLSSISNTIVSCKNRIRKAVGEDIEDIYNQEYNYVIMGRKKKRKITGLGDVVESITTATGIKKAVHWVAGEDCGCDERKEKLNKLFPIGKKPKCLTESEYEWLDNWFNGIGRSKMRDAEQRAFLAIFNRVFETQYNTTNCGDCINAKLDQLKKVYDEYKKEIAEV
jgi:RNA polymerase sigma factor (sigma-70 family)